jgi:hypothetical protein
VGGGRGASNQYLLDGVDDNDPYGDRRSAPGGKMVIGEQSPGFGYRLNEKVFLNAETVTSIW